ncbi:MAG: hypothetical protein ACLTZM_10075 [Ruminococcus sp.]
MRYTTGGEKPVINRVKTVDGERNFIQNLKPEKVRDGYRARVFFDWKEEEEIHGLGQAEEGIYNYRGHNQVSLPAQYEDPNASVCFYRRIWSAV